MDQCARGQLGSSTTPKPHDPLTNPCTPQSISNCFKRRRMAVERRPPRPGDRFEDAFITALVLWRELLPDADRAALPSAPIDIGVRSLRSHSAVGAAADSDRRAGI